MAPRIVYCDDSKPGITRKKVRHGWGYWDADGKRITDRDEIDRLNAIGLPPAYRDAWFCPKPNGHIQAVGWDDKGRKQYRYHPGFREAQEAAKYDRCADFGQRAAQAARAGRGRSRSARPAARSAPSPRSSACSTSATSASATRPMRKANKSFGATTLRKRHAKVKRRHAEAPVTRAKSGKDARADDHRPLAQPLRQEDARTCRASICSAGSTTTARRIRSPRPTSTTISARRPATISPPSISAPGARASSRSRRWPTRRARPRPQDDARAGDRSARQHARRSRANPMSTPR